MYCCCIISLLVHRHMGRIFDKGNLNIKIIDRVLCDYFFGFKLILNKNKNKILSYPSIYVTSKLQLISVFRSDTLSIIRQLRHFALGD